MRSLAGQQRGARLLLRRLLVEVALAVHPVLMDDLARGVQNHHRRSGVVRLGEGLAAMRELLRDVGRDRHMVVDAEFRALRRVDEEF